MGLFSLSNLFGITLRESADNGSDFTNPDADYRRVFLGEDGELHTRDSAGTVATLGGSGAVTTHLADGTDAHDASAISFSPTGTVAATDVQAAIAEVASESSAPVGKPLYGIPYGWSSQITSTGNYDLAAISGANGGAFAVPVTIEGAMSAEGIAIVNGDTATARSCEFRLYLDGGDSTADFVTGASGTMSFTPSAVSVRRASFASPPVALAAGTYWLVIRNTHATSTFGVRRGSGAVAGMYACQTHTGIAALGASLELRTSWTSQISVPHAWVEGRVLGLTAALT